MVKKKIQPPKVSKKKLVKIQSKEAYELTMKEINSLMKKGERNLRPADVTKLRTLAEMSEAYEDKFQA